MTVAEGLGFTGVVFIFAALVLGISSDASKYVNYLSIPAWVAFVLAVLCWLASIWVGVLT